VLSFFAGESGLLRAVCAPMEGSDAVLRLRPKWLIRGNVQRGCQIHERCRAGLRPFIPQYMQARSTCGIAAPESVSPLSRLNILVFPAPLQACRTGSAEEDLRLGLDAETLWARLLRKGQTRMSTVLEPPGPCRGHFQDGGYDIVQFGSAPEVGIGKSTGFGAPAAGALSATGAMNAGSGTSRRLSPAAPSRPPAA